jgi:hypothetical protein
MPNRIEILEIIRPATQGRSRPFYCRGSDGQHYFVKGRPRSSQGAEWICAHLAMEFGLPIAPFAIVEIDPALLREAQDDWQHLGSGPSFGSCAVSGVSWLERENTDKVSTDTQRDILVFDWWIQNQDRTVFNTNLLWQATEGRLTVIDHNLAFDKEFNPAGFLEGHLFRTQWDTLDLDRRAGYHRRLVDALPALQKACASLPHEWSWYDADQPSLATSISIVLKPL